MLNKSLKIGFAFNILYVSSLFFIYPYYLNNAGINEDVLFPCILMQISLVQISSVIQAYKKPKPELLYYMAFIYIAILLYTIFKGLTVESVSFLLLLSTSFYLFNLDIIIAHAKYIFKTNQ